MFITSPCFCLSSLGGKCASLQPCSYANASNIHWPFDAIIYEYLINF